MLRNSEQFITWLSAELNYKAIIKWLFFNKFNNIELEHLWFIGALLYCYIFFRFVYRHIKLINILPLLLIINYIFGEGHQLFYLPAFPEYVTRKGRVGEVYNVGGHNEKQNIEIVKIICKELGKPESLITHVGDRKGHDMRYAIDPTKIHNELGWLPETKFEDGIKKTIQWYLDNREWWETIISGEYQNYYEKMYSNR